MRTFAARLGGHRGSRIRTSILALACGASQAGCGNAGTAFEEPFETEQQPVVFDCGTACSSWVYRALFQDGLVYVPDDQGDRMPDFSQVGYKRGALGGLPTDNTCGFFGDETCLPPDGSGPAVPLASLGSPPPPTTAAAPSDICANNQTRSHLYDHGIALQALLDQAGQTFKTTGVVQRVYLPRGHYAIWQKLYVPSGVVLRGVSSDGSPPTVLHACSSSLGSFIVIDSDKYGTLDTSTGAVVVILDDMVPSGSNAVQVPFTHPFAVNDRVRVTRTPCPEFVDPSNNGQGPTADEYTDHYTAKCPGLWSWTQAMGAPVEWYPDQIAFERSITRIEPVLDASGNAVRARIFLDSPLTNALEANYAPHTIQKYSTPPKPVTDAAVYRLRAVAHAGTTALCTAGNLVCYNGNGQPSCNSNATVVCTGGSPNGTPDCRDDDGNNVGSAFPYCERPKDFISIGSAENVWVNDVKAYNFADSAVALHTGSRWVTVDDVESRDPMGPITGQWRYTYANAGQMNLIAHAYAEDGRHDFIVGAWRPGPNVFLESESTGAHNDSGPHHRWATGTLFDNVDIHDDVPGSLGHGQLNIRNRYNDPGESYQGWTGSSMVAWNSHAAEGFRYFNPPTGQNWLIGASGDKSPVSANMGAPDPNLGESLPYFDAGQTTITNTKAGPLVISGGGTLPPEVGASLYRSAAFTYATRENLQVRQYFVGDPDSFMLESTDTINDSVFVNAAFKTWLASTTAVPFWRGFDYTTSDAKSIAFSIRYDLAAGIPGQVTAEEVIQAYLAVRIQRTGSWTRDSDHMIQIAGVGTNGSGMPNDFYGYAEPTQNAQTFFWRCTDASVKTPNMPSGFCRTMPPEMTGPRGWSTTTAPGGEVRIIELPGYWFRGLLNRTVTQTANGVTRRFGEINVNFSRSERVDWANLTLVTMRQTVQ